MLGGSCPRAIAPASPIGPLIDSSNQTPARTACYCCCCLEHGCKTRLFTTVGDAQASHCARHAKTQKHSDAANNGIIGALAPRLFMLVLKSYLGGKIRCSKVASMVVFFLVWAVGIQPAICCSVWRKFPGSNCSSITSRPAH